MPWVAVAVLISLAGAIVVAARRSPSSTRDDEWRGVPVPEVGQEAAPQLLDVTGRLGARTYTGPSSSTPSGAVVDAPISRDVRPRARSRVRAGDASVGQGSTWRGRSILEALREARAATSDYAAQVFAAWPQLAALDDHLADYGVRLTFAPEVPTDWRDKGVWFESAEDVERLEAGEAVRLHPLMFTHSAMSAARNGQVFVDDRGRWHVVELARTESGILHAQTPERAPVHDRHTLDLRGGGATPDRVVVEWEERHPNGPRGVAQGDAQHIVTSVLYVEPGGESMPYGPNAAAMP